MVSAEFKIYMITINCKKNKHTNELTTNLEHLKVERIFEVAF